MIHHWFLILTPFTDTIRPPRPSMAQPPIYDSRVQTLARPAATVLAAFALSACNGPAQEESERPSYPGLVRERLTELEGLATAFTSLSVTPDGITANAPADGEHVSWDLIEEPRELDRRDQPRPAAPFDVLDPEAVQRLVEELASECDTGFFHVRVEALTPTATTAQLLCGEDEVPTPGLVEPAKVLLNGEPLPTYESLTPEETWQQVLDQSAALGTEPGVANVSITDESISMRLSTAIAPSECRLYVTFEADGSDLAWMCFGGAHEPAPGLHGYSAEELAQLQLAAMEDGDIDGFDDLAVTLGQDLRGEAVMQVRQRGAEGTAPLG